MNSTPIDQPAKKPRRYFWSRRTWVARLEKRAARERELRETIRQQRRALAGKDKQIEILENRVEAARETILTLQQRLHTARSMANAVATAKAS